jgi:hypothetical protein
MLEELWKLLQEKDRLMDMAVQMGEMSPAFVERLRSLDERISEAVGIITVDRLDTLKTETVRLTTLSIRLARLTLVLIALTGFLALIALVSLLHFV